MNIFQLTFKQMRQRALSTWLTLLSVVLGVGLAVAILLLYREGDKLFAQADFGYDVIVGAKTGGKLNLVLNSVYQLGGAPVTISYSVYEDLLRNPNVRWAIPWAVGDNYQGYRVIGTSGTILGIDAQDKPLPPGKAFEYRAGRPFELAAGRPFASRKFEAVIGDEVAVKTDLRLGSRFKASHGAEQAGLKDEHDETWEVVGILKPTETAMDRVIFIPAISAMAVPSHAKVIGQIAELQAGAATRPADGIAHDEHHDDHDAAAGGADHDDDAKADGEDHDHDAKAEGEHHHHDAHYTLSPDGTISLKLPPDKWRLSAVLVRSAGQGLSQNIIFEVDNLPYATAVNPAREMRAFFDTFLKGSRAVLLVIAALVSVVAAVGILVSIYNSVSARLKEIAIIRALGATRGRVLTLICLEAGMVGLIGSVLGLILGHTLGGVGSVFFRRFVGEGIDYITVSPEELEYLLAVVVISVVAGLVPALKAYKTPVARNLVG